MSTTKKYYTPTIEEFHVGFRYELLGLHKRWNKEVVVKETFTEAGDGDWGFSDTYCIALPISQTCIDKNEVRVKYLDQQDIEELGFKSCTTGLWGGYLTYQLDFNTSKYYQIQVDFNDSEIGIFVFVQDPLSNVWEATLIFNGEIKNYNELQRLLKQLNIAK